MIDCLKKQLDFGVHRDRCFCLGEGKNLEYLQRINKAHNFFSHIVPLSHPRFIMQYRRKLVAEYVEEYRTKMA